MEIIANAISTYNYEQYYNSVIAIKGNVGWIAAIRLQTQSKLIENAFYAK